MERKKEEKISKEELELKIIKSKIEIEETSLDRYVKTILRNDFMDCCTGGAFFNNLFHKLLQQGSEEIRKSEKSEKEKNKLRVLLFPIFGINKTELEMAQENLEYIKRKVNWAKSILTMLNNEKKEKIILDCIEQQELWFSQFDRNSKVYKALKEKVKEEKPKTKPKKKTIKK